MDGGRGTGKPPAGSNANHRFDCGVHRTLPAIGPRKAPTKRVAMSVFLLSSKAIGAERGRGGAALVLERSGRAGTPRGPATALGQALDEAFERAMDLPILIRLFGQGASATASSRWRTTSHGGRAASWPPCPLPTTLTSGKSSPVVIRRVPAHRGCWNRCPNSGRTLPGTRRL